jgi:ribosome-associated translation inhibitor RaiA
MTEPLNHKLDVSKIKTLKDVKNVFECMNLYASAEEDNEQYELLKEYFTIPYEQQEIKFELPRKSLEEISQEFDEKIDKQIERVKEKFNQLGYTQEYHYQVKFNRIIENFEYAKEHGQFPVRLTVGKLDCSTLGVSSVVDWTTEFRIGKDEVGYWDIKPNIKVYLKKKPNRVVRYFTRLLLDFTWKDK